MSKKLRGAALVILGLTVVLVLAAIGPAPLAVAAGKQPPRVPEEEKQQDERRPGLETGWHHANIVWARRRHIQTSRSRVIAISAQVSGSGTVGTSLESGTARPLAR